MYTLSGYAGMISDHGRTDAYARALEAVVRPTSAVLDVGTGTGMFALLACRFGARKVYAVEASNVIEVAREVAAANGYADRIVFIQALSTKIELPEKVDVIVSDIRGISPLFQGSVPALIDARDRFLAPGGTMIPSRDIIFAAPVNAPALYDEIVSTWSQDNRGVDLSAVRKFALNQYGKGRLATTDYLAEPQLFATLDFGAISSPNVANELRWKIANAGVFHGVAVWFDCETYPGIGFSNAPGAERHIYAQQFFPMLDPVAVEAGDSIDLKLTADVTRDDYFWRWDTTIADAGGAIRSRFQQSSLAGALVGPAQLRKRGQSFVARLNPDAQIDKFVLEQMASAQTLGDIAHALTLAFPNQFADWQAALARVADLSARYST